MCIDKVQKEEINALKCQLIKNEKARKLKTDSKAISNMKEENPITERINNVTRLCTNSDFMVEFYFQIIPLQAKSEDCNWNPDVTRSRFAGTQVCLI